MLLVRGRRFLRIFVGVACFRRCGAHRRSQAGASASRSDRVNGSGLDKRLASDGCVDGGFSGGGTFSEGLDNVSAGVFSAATVGGAAVALSLENSAVGGAGAEDPSTLPKMIGRPSFPLPTITIFELLDWAS